MKSYPIFEFAEQCLHSDSIQQKLDLTATACRLWREGRFECDFEKPPKPISATRFSKRPELVDPRELPRRNMASKEGRIALLHAIAHIEFYAIHLAWDIIYRFQDMPQLFYGDWLGVAAEEAQHFSLIRKRLQELDSDYGLLPAHRGLWEVAEDTDHDVLARLALVPRYMEARGLDVTPGMIEKLRGVGDHSSAQILVTIVNEEVGHVLIGSRWCPGTWAKICPTGLLMKQEKVCSDDCLEVKRWVYWITFGLPVQTAPQSRASGSKLWFPTNERKETSPLIYPKCRKNCWRWSENTST